MVRKVTLPLTDEALENLIDDAKWLKNNMAEILIQDLNDKNPDVKLNAASTLRSFPEVASSLINGKIDADDNDIALISSAGAMYSNVERMARAYMESEDPKIRKRCLTVLGSSGKNEYIDLMIGMLDDQEADIRSLAAAFLAGKFPKNLKVKNAFKKYNVRKASELEASEVLRMKEVLDKEELKGLKSFLKQESSELMQQIDDLLEDDIFKKIAYRREKNYLKNYRKIIKRI